MHLVVDAVVVRSGSSAIVIAVVPDQAGDRPARPAFPGSPGTAWPHSSAPITSTRGSTSPADLAAAVTEALAFIPDRLDAGRAVHRRVLVASYGERGAGVTSWSPGLVAVARATSSTS